MDSENHAKVSRYFRYKKQPLGWSVGLFIFGIIFMLVGGAAYFEEEAFGFAVVLGLLFVVISAVIVIVGRSQMPTDSEIDKLLGNGLKELPSIALHKLGLVDSQVVADYIYLWSPASGDLRCTSQGRTFIPHRFKQGEDGRFRFSRYNVMFLVPTETSLCIFRAMYEFLENTTRALSTGQYFYKDIVSIVTTGDTNLSLSFTDGRSVIISIPSALNALNIYESADVPFIPFDKAVQVVRTMVQEHKKA